MFDVITTGSATRDVLMKAEGFELRKHADSPTGIEQCFPLGSKLEIKEVFFTTGGGGTNSAVTFARQGFKTACVGVVGDDINGKEILEELKREKVKPLFQVHGQVTKTPDGNHRPDGTAYSIILVYPDAERTILSYKGEGQHFDLKAIPFGKLKAKWFYIDSLGGHYDLFEALVNHAVKNGIKIACNPGGKEIAHGRDKLAPLLAKIDIFILNKEEGIQLLNSKFQTRALNNLSARPSTFRESALVPNSKQFSNSNYQNSKSAGEILKELSTMVKGIVVLTDGHNGARVRSGNREYRAGVPDSPVVERTGAGDAFGSGFVAEYIRETRDKRQETSAEAIMKAIQFATANASSVVTKFGAKAGILKKGDYGFWPLVNVEESAI